MNVEKARTIFFEIVAQVPPEQWAERLAELAGDDEEVRQRVHQLLAAHREAGSFLESPARALGGTLEERLSEGPGTVIGHYKLLEQIGEGGFGVVFMAEQTQPVRRKVALKVLKPGMDTRQVVARFEAERQALAIMDHPNIAKVLDGGATASGRPYFVMELVKGVPVTEFCDQNHLTPRQRLELFGPICHAVQHAHQKGIIHRDLKPSNVLVTMHDDKPVVKVIDFGVAKARGHELTEKTLFTGFAQMIGTPLYMSPEQAGQSGLDVDTRSDIYSLGVLLYELLTGTTPFDKDRFKRAAYDEIRRIIRDEEPPRPSTRLSEAQASLASISAQRHTDPAKLTKLLQGELDWIVMKCLEKDRNRRYETAGAFAADVQRYLNDEPVQACPPTAWYRLGKFARRNKGAAAMLSAAALVVVLAVIGLTVSNVLISRERDEKDKALSQAKINEEAATEQRRQAQQNLKHALGAVDQMLTRVSEERLRDVPQMEPVRRELLLDALKFYQKFLEKSGDDPAIRRETARAYWNIGSLHLQLGDYGKAEAAYRTAFTMFDELDAEAAPEPAMRAQMIAHHMGFAWVLRNQAKFAEGEKALRRAVAVAEGLLRDFPDVPLHRDRLIEASNRLAAALAAPGPKFFNPGTPAQLEEAEKILHRNLKLSEGSTKLWDRAQTYQALGDLLQKQRRLPEAEKACRQGLDLFEKALAKAPSPKLQVDVAGTLKQLAGLVHANGRPDEAEPIYRRALPLFDKFAADFPAGPHNRWGQADTHFQHALLLHKLKKNAEAEKAYRRTVELFDKLANDFPTLPGYRATAVHRRHHLAVFLAESGRAAEAHQVYGEAAALIEKLAPAQKAKALTTRGHFYADLDEQDKAAADLTRAIELGSDDIFGAWCSLALVHLSAGRTDEYRSLCEMLLKRFDQTESEWVVATCLLAPKAVTDSSRPVHLAEKLVAREPKNADYMAILGVALYRKGDWKEAAQKLEASFHSGFKMRETQAPKLVLAMAYHRLGRDAEAKELLQEVTRWLNTNTEKKEGASSAVPLPWGYRLGLQLLQREAAELLQ